jgi:hypothetical protein
MSTINASDKTLKAEASAPFGKLNAEKIKDR